MVDFDIKNMMEMKNGLFISLFPSLFVILIFLLSFKDIFKFLLKTKKGIKRIYFLFLFAFIFLAAIGCIVLYFIVKERISMKKLNKTIFSKCYDEKLEEAKEEIIEECENKN